MLEPILMKLGMCITVPGHIKTAYVIRTSHQFVSVCVALLANDSVNTFTRQRIHAIFYGLCVCLYISLSLLGNGSVNTPMKNSWRRRFLCGPYRIKGKLTISHPKNFLFVVPNNLIETDECYVTCNNLALEKISVGLSDSSLSMQC
jgi:hypothetical protein